ncbi:MAG: tRNA pseudouridine(55) synthase TruB [Patescibacteria group bacterium]
MIVEQKNDLYEVRNINKPMNWTSFDVCNYLKKQYPRKTKIGHAGTLDPLATGVLIVAIGKATKDISKLQDTQKEYIAEVTLGAVTKTFDSEFYPDYINPTSDITKNNIEEVLVNFRGEIEQTPPIYSAIKIDGQRAYDLARSGKEVEMKPRVVEIYSIEIIDFEQKEEVTKFKIKILCSKGTYIRTLANDIGKELGCGGFMSSLIRTKVGDYSIEESESIQKQ